MVVLITTLGQIKPFENVCLIGFESTKMMMSANRDFLTAKCMCNEIESKAR